MARDTGKESYLNRILPALPLRLPNNKIIARWAVVGLCLLFWIVILWMFVL